MFNRFKHNLTVRKKLLIFQGCFVCLLFLLIAVYLMTVYSNSLLNSQKENIENSLQYLNNNITAQLEAINSVDIDVRVSSEVKENLNKTDYISYGRAFTKITDFLSSKVFGIPGLRHAIIIDMHNHVYTVDLPLQFPSGFLLESTEAFQAASQAPSKLVWLSYNDIYEKYGLGYGDYRIRSDIHAASIIKNYTTGETQGILILTLNENYFKNIFKSNSTLEKSNVFLVSPDNQKYYILSSEEPEISPDILKELPLSNKTKGTLVLNKSLITYDINTEMNWYIVCAVKLKSLQHDVYKYILPLLIIIGLSLFFFFIASDRAFNSMTKGINTLSASMHQFEKGDFNVKISSCSDDEIGRLSQGFNHMVEQIKNLIDTQYKMAVMTREAEYKSLQAQINPHFLYNTLDMLNWQLVIRGEEKLSESVVAIGNCLRYSISDGNTKSTLHDEINNIKDYISIQTLINEKPIDLVLDAEDADIIILPKLTLQPLVENAFLHGFIGRESNNSLSITGNYSTPERTEYTITE